MGKRPPQRTGTQIATARDQRLNSRPQRAIWNTAKWRNHTRPEVLRRANGQCQWPSGCTRPATIADHYPIPCLDLMNMGLEANDPDRCRALCAHHSGKADGGRRRHGGATKSMRVKTAGWSKSSALPDAQNHREPVSVTSRAW